MPWVSVANAGDIRVGEARAVEIDGRRIAIFNVEGEFLVTDDTCTHEEASLANGFLEDHLIECPLHGSQFDLRTGEVISLPAVLPVMTYPVKVEGGEISVEVHTR